MKKLLLCGTTVLALSGAPALAADLPRKAPPPPPPPVCIWCGFYIGVHGGYGQADVDTVFRDVGDFNLLPGDRFSHSPDGALFGGHLGFNWQFGGNWLFGFEVAGTWSDIRETVVSPFFPLTDSISSEVNWLFTFTPRLGITTGNWLFYVKGGLAVADFSVTFNTIDPSFAPFTSFEASETRSGWTIGGGFEVLTGSTWPFGSGGSWVFGVEGNYYDFGSVDVLSIAPAPFLTNHDHDITMWSVLGRLSWKFGGQAPVAARY